MTTLCGRCGYERKPTDHAPPTECPSCGVIYARIEAQRSQERQLQQVRLVSKVRKTQELVVDRSFGGLLAFNWMLTPLLVRVTFVLGVIAAGVAFIGAVMAGEPALAAGVLIALLIGRIALEAVIVVFRISDDVSAVRKLLADQALATLREQAAKEAA